MPGTRPDAVVGDLWVVWAVVAGVSNWLRFYVPLYSAHTGNNFYQYSDDYPQLPTTPKTRANRAFPVGSAHLLTLTNNLCHNLYTNYGRTTMFVMTLYICGHALPITVDVDGALVIDAPDDVYAAAESALAAYIEEGTTQGTDWRIEP